MSINFSILITTRNRIEDLKITIQSVESLLNSSEVECLIYDDASTDGTYEFLEKYYPKIKRFKNEKPLGLIHNRNVLLNNCIGKYAISLDDDANFITTGVLQIIETHFQKNTNCGVIACRIFWGKEKPLTSNTNHKLERVRGFVGCGHVWNLKAWKEIPNYPEWFVFYGEEEFASYHLFKKNWEVHYVPDILVHHRVDNKARKDNKDYTIRQRRSLRAGWYLYFMFYPWRYIPRRMSYTFWMQLKNKTFKGDWEATKGILQAIWDVIVNLPRLMKESNRLTKQQYEEYCKLALTKIYWMPNKYE